LTLARIIRTADAKREEQKEKKKEHKIMNKEENGSRKENFYLYSSLLFLF
jgi:hypothetical protein